MTEWLERRDESAMPHNTHTNAIPRKTSNPRRAPLRARSTVLSGHDSSSYAVMIPDQAGTDTAADAVKTASIKYGGDTAFLTFPRGHGFTGRPLQCATPLRHVPHELLMATIATFTPMLLAALTCGTWAALQWRRSPWHVGCTVPRPLPCMLPSQLPRMRLPPPMLDVSAALKIEE